MNYSNFKEHIGSIFHKESVLSDKDGIFEEIDNLITEFNDNFNAKDSSSKDTDSILALDEELSKRKIVKIVRQNLKKQMSSVVSGEPFTNNSQFVSQTNFKSGQTTTVNTKVEHNVFQIQNVLNLNTKI